MESDGETHRVDVAAFVPLPYRCARKRVCPVHFERGGVLTSVISGVAERIPCVLIDAHSAAKTHPKISSSFEGCRGTIEQFDPHRGDDTADGRGRYKVRLEVPGSRQSVGRLAPGGLFSSGKVSLSLSLSFSLSLSDFQFRRRLLLGRCGTVEGRWHGCTRGTYCWLR